MSSDAKAGLILSTAPFKASTQDEDGVYRLNMDQVFRVRFSDGEGDFVFSAGSTFREVPPRYSWWSDPLTNFSGMVAEVMKDVPDTLRYQGDFSQSQGRVQEMKYQYTPIADSADKELKFDWIDNRAPLEVPIKLFNIDVDHFHKSEEPDYKEPDYMRVFREIPSGDRIRVVTEDTELLLRHEGDLGTENKVFQRCLVKPGFIFRELQVSGGVVCTGTAVLLHPKSLRGGSVDWGSVQWFGGIRPISVPEHEWPKVNEHHYSEGIVSQEMNLPPCPTQEALSTAARVALERKWDLEAENDSDGMAEELEEQLCDGTEEGYDWLKSRPERGSRG